MIPDRAGRHAGILREQGLLHMYSQTGEEGVIMRTVRTHPGGGKFIDIGAYDGLKYSNTRKLFDAGWGGIMVEASPRNFVKLQENLGGYDRVKLICAAMSNSHGFTRFNDTGDEYAKADDKGGIYVPRITWEDLLNLEDGPWAVVSIDAEGISADLFLSMPLKAMSPWCVCVEHDGRHVEIANAGAAHHAPRTRTTET